VEDTNIVSEIIWTERETISRREEMYSDDSLLALSVVLSAILSAAPALVALACNCFM
jgi:hypothetical protein